MQSVTLHGSILIPMTPNIFKSAIPPFTSTSRKLHGLQISLIIEFILQIVYQATSNSTPVDIGIYTNAQDWAAVFGDWEELSNLPLWWNVVGDTSLMGFLSFGGWKIGSNIFRQYQRNVNICGNNFDVSFRPIIV
jgi:hypothetical protein